jgi:hypothetical protein
LRHALFHRLDVHVARLALDRAPHDEIDQVDDRSRFAALRQAGDRLEDLFLRAADQRRLRCARVTGAAVFRRADGQFRPGLRNSHQRFVRITGLDRFQNVAAGRDHLLDAIAGLEFEILHQAEQQRIGHRHRQQVLLEADGDADALECDFLGNQDDGGRLRGILGKADVRKPELHGQRLRDLLFSREIHADENDAEALTGTLVLDQCVFEIVVADEACLNEALTNFLAQS